MRVQTTWFACTVSLLTLSPGTANGPAGSFFVARHRHRSRTVPAGLVQPPHREPIAAAQLLDMAQGEDRLGGLRVGVGRFVSIAAAVIGGGREQEPRKQAKAAESNHDADDGQVAAAEGTVAAAAVDGQQRTRGMSSPLQVLSSTRQQLGQRATSMAGAICLRERSPRRWAATLRTRGGGGGDLASTPPDDRWRNAIEGLKNGVASGLAAACVKTVLQPFDTMKTVQQFSTTRMTLLQAGRNLLARGGVSELYQGLGVTLVGSMPAVGVYFGLYQFVKKQMDGKDGMSPYVSITVSAGVGNFIASFFRVPYEVVKQRLQVGQYPSTMLALTSIYRERGLIGFFGKGGLKMQWARDIPYAMVTLLVYETLQKAAARKKAGAQGAPGSPGESNGAKANPLENMVIGAIAGGMGSLVTNPMDMIKTRMMTSPELYAGPMDAAWKALSKEGPQAFLKGATPRLLHKIPANAFFFLAYEFFRNVLGVTR